MLGRVREEALKAYAYQDLPFEKLVEKLQPERDLSRTPLFQVFFILANSVDNQLNLPGLTTRPLEIHNETAKFDLTLRMVENAQGELTANLNYNTDLFDDSTIQRMLGHFQTLLEGLVANPDQRLSNLPLLTETERHQLLVAWNNTTRVWECGSVGVWEYGSMGISSHTPTLPYLFEAQVERIPDVTAVVFENQALTYSELNKRANQLAHYLRKHGVGPDVLVGICIERSLEMMVGLLGILKAGGAYVPLDPTYPKERLAFMLEDAQVSMLLTQQQLVNLGFFNPQSAIHNPQLKMICLDTDWEAIAQESEGNPVSKATPESLAYVIYTSGSTGRPKGVQISHCAVVNLLNSVLQQPHATGQQVEAHGCEPLLTDQDTFLAVTTLSFDIAALELFLPLTVGARLVMVSREVASDGKQLLEQLVRSGATAMQATPATWRLLLEAYFSNEFRTHPGLTLPLRRMLCGG
ncbi:MAG: AMP-binding protein, partial [Nitrospira sp.]|nr:AMP-binding protein [Nitrospira sp.]